MLTRRVLTIAVVVAALASPTFAQAPPNAAIARVGYNSLKNRVKPDGDLKIAIDAIDKEIAEAMRLGQTAEMRRLIAKGMALLNKRPWTDTDDFDQSLVLRSERQFVDSSLPYHVRLEQIFAPVMQLTSPPTARATVRPLLASPAGAGDPMRIAEFSDVSRDLRDMPLHMELDLSAVPDGPYMLDVDVMDGTAKLGTASLRIAIQKGLEARLAGLEKAALAAIESVRADIRYPADYLRKVNRGMMELGQFDLAKELLAAETIAAAAKGGKDPFANRTGDFERHYLLEAAGEIMPYRVYVPSTYNAAKATPLVVALHGLGGNEDGMMDNYGKRVPELAEQHGFIAVSPLGYRLDGFYGFSYGNDAASKRKQEFSEQDVMQVLARMRRDFKVDDSRIYLMGHSMGAIGTWFLGAKYPDIWAGLGTFAGTGAPASVARIKHIPQFVVHGDNDPTVPVGGSRGMVAEMKTQAVDHVYIEVPGGGHSDVVVPNLAGMFEFFATKKKLNSLSKR